MSVINKNTIKNALNRSISSAEKESEDKKVDTPESTEAPVSNAKPKKKEKPKRRRGRPSKTISITKIHLILEKRGITRKELYNLIAEKYPDEPISPDAISRIVSGRRKYYSTTTLYRICGALNLTPNQVLDYEKEIK
jgi:DNA-binding Xre family transcriptional regulator